MGGGGGERTRLSIQHSTFAFLPPPAPFHHPPCAVCPSVLTERRKRFRWLASMMDGQKRCRFYRQRFIFEGTTPFIPRCGSFYSLFQRIAPTISFEKNIRRILDEPTIHEEERWFIERESNVDKESRRWNEGRESKPEGEGRKRRKRRRYDPRSVNRTIHRANCKSRISGDWS